MSARVARLPWQDATDRWPQYDTLVLVPCPMCERWIAHEDRHHCDLPQDVARRRSVARVQKQRELTG